ncbi:hypothetical protein CFE70_005239 [Pyrenophora teres f. teres 0-1]|uniref:Uncharacterized protein n=2 Tax=Pyrenophora teres f. teres TaxID=97479 RepID=E3RLN8_PYRTT|nr:hypothetical protein PTT_09295 [Pyrenophora teres f. teres 0-1]CAE7174905.1 hypothetical protein PTTW11_05710 [Pyrenophora teres f. teres]
MAPSLPDGRDPDDYSSSSHEDIRNDGEEQVATNDNDGNLDPTAAFTAAFRLFALPPELRHYIYSFLIPQSLTITFKHHTPERSSRYTSGAYWASKGVKKDGSVIQIGGDPFHKHTQVRRHHHFKVELQLLRLSKFFCNDVQSVLYGQNTYKFTVHGKSLVPISLRSPMIFGAIGQTQDTLSQLRNLRHIHIDVVAENYHWAVKRQRARLEYFVEILKMHADNADKKSLLEHLKVNFTMTPGDFVFPRDIEESMFGLESLVSLRGIRHVEFTGLPDWFTNCMQLAIKGQSGDVEMADWPLMEVKRSTNSVSNRMKVRWISSRKWYQPTLNWKKFAEQNGVDVPEDIDKFWATVG